MSNVLCHSKFSKPVGSSFINAILRSVTTDGVAAHYSRPWVMKIYYLTVNA
jgi:hypothetical protein